MAEAGTDGGSIMEHPEPYRAVTEPAAAVVTMAMVAEKERLDSSRWKPNNQGIPGWDSKFKVQKSS